MTEYAGSCRVLIKRGTDSVEKARMYLQHGETSKAAAEVVNGAQDLLTVKKVTDARMADEKDCLFRELTDLERSAKEAGAAFRNYILLVKQNGQTLKELGLEDLENLFGSSKEKTSS